MKSNKLVVIVNNKKGDCYQVSLSDTEAFMVLDLISQLHNGKIKIMGPKLAMKLDTIK